MEKITPRAEDYSKWYADVIEAAELADSSPVRGCMVIRPYGYAIWEKIQQVLDEKIKVTGVQNAYFPLLIPKSFLEREAKHVEGFAKECAVVTHHRLALNPKTQKLEPAGELEEPLVIRPTSETIIYHTFAKWVESYRDLPLLINQWANVVRWEMRTRPFLRTTEFLWQEGHTAHATAEEAQERARQMIQIYADFARDFLAMPSLVGLKSESEKFAGADRTYTFETMTSEGKALQSGTSHLLGQNFAKAFGIHFLDEKGETQFTHQTSWGVSTRIMGGMIMTHSDDKGLVLPPSIAPLKVVILPIWKDAAEKNLVGENARGLAEQLKAAGLTVKIDDRDLRPGIRFFEWEKKGVPVRLEIGPKDVATGQVVLVRRDTGKKLIVSQNAASEKIENLLDEVQKELLARAEKHLTENTFRVDDKKEFVDLLAEKNCFVAAHWCGAMECEEAIKDETKATTRCIPEIFAPEAGKCISCGKPTESSRVIFAKAY